MSHDSTNLNLHYQNVVTSQNWRIVLGALGIALGTSECALNGYFLIRVLMSPNYDPVYDMVRTTQVMHFQYFAELIFPLLEGGLMALAGLTLLARSHALLPVVVCYLLVNFVSVFDWFVPMIVEADPKQRLSVRAFSFVSIAAAHLLFYGALTYFTVRCRERIQSVCLID